MKVWETVFFAGIFCILTVFSSADGAQIISSGANKDGQKPLTTVTDSNGNVWVAWTEGELDVNNDLINRDIFLCEIFPGVDNFENDNVIQVTNDAPDQANPVLAKDSSDNLYLVWQDQRSGNWDLYVKTSSDGTNWSSETRITDPDFNQTSPAMDVDSNGEVFIVYDDDQNGYKDIYMTFSRDGFASKVTTQISDGIYDETAPDIAIDASDTVYVVWTDQRNSAWSGGKKPKFKPAYDVYGAASNNSWTNIEVIDIAKDGNQTTPKIATEDSGSILHFVWVDDEPGDKEVYYDSSDGLPATPLTGINIIDPNLINVEQKQPAIVVAGSGESAKAFVCWEDERDNVVENIYAVEATNRFGYNIWIGDDGTGAGQKVPAIVLDQYNEPFLVWVQNKNEIVYAGSTFEDPIPEVAPSLVSASAETTIGDTGSFSATFLAGAYDVDMDVWISLVRNPPKNPLEKHSMLYEFGPSGITFSKPVTLTIPYDKSKLGNKPIPYRLDPLTGQLSIEGISEVTYGSGVVSFKTTHFSDFVLGGGGAGSQCHMTERAHKSMEKLNNR